MIELRKETERVQTALDHLLDHLEGCADEHCSVCMRTSEATATVVQALADAARWRALTQCARIRVTGSAGFGTPSGREGYRHVGLEIWTQFSAPTIALSEMLDQQRADAVAKLVEFTDIVTKEPKP